MIKELMQYDRKRDDKVTKLTLSEAAENPVLKLLIGGDNARLDYLRASHAQRYASQRDTPTEVITSRKIDHSKEEEIDLYNALWAMEFRNPSASRIRSEVEFISDRVGTVIGRDFQTNQPNFYETRVLQENYETQEHLKRKLGTPILKEEPIPPRALFLGFPETLGYDHLNTSSGRLVGVRKE